MLTAEEMIEIIEERWKRSKLARDKTDHIYESSITMIKTIAKGSDVDAGCEWMWKQVEDMSCFDKSDREYYNLQVGGLMNLIDEWLKCYRRKENENRR